MLNRGDSASMALALAGRTQVTFGLDAPALKEDYGIVETPEGRWLARGAERIVALEELPLAGAHNVSNALAACALSQAAGAPLATLAEGLRSFQGLPHRMQRVALRNGVAWYDDSKGTNVGATLPPAVQGYVTIQSAEFKDGGDGRLLAVLDGEARITQEQVKLLSDQVKERLAASR